MLTSDPVYPKPYKPTITIEPAPGGGSDLYGYDPWTGGGTITTTGHAGCFPTHLSVAVSENNHGVIVLQIDDSNMDMDTYKIGQGAMILVGIGKQSTQITNIIRGIVRKVGYSRGQDNKVFLNLIASSASIRLNENIIYFVQEANRTGSGAYDISDTDMQAKNLLEAAMATEAVHGILQPNTTGSDVITWLPRVDIEYGELADLVSLLEEATGADVYTDVSNNVQFRYQLRAPAGGRGFTIKNKKGSQDDADDTCYFRGKNWGLEESIYKADSFAQIVYSILPPETDIPSDINDLGVPVGEYNNSDTDSSPSPTLNEWGCKFRPTYGHVFPSDILLAIQVASVGNTPPPPYVYPTFRILQDNGSGTPINTNGTVVTIKSTRRYGKENDEDGRDPHMFNEFQFINPSGSVVGSIVLDTTKDYWMVLTDDNINNGWEPSEFLWVEWLYGNTKTADIIKRSSASGSGTTNANGGSGWSFWANTNKPLFEMPRRRSHSMSMWNPISMKHVHYAQPSIRIGATIPTMPSFVKSRELWYKYTAYLLQYMSRPRWNARSMTVSAPNVPPLPGDALIISDSVLGYSGPGNDYMISKCGDMMYSWHDFNAPRKRSKETILTLNPVLTVPRLK